MRPILPACPTCVRRRLGAIAGMASSADLCPACGGFGVMLDTTIPPMVRQMIDAWRDEPAWHRAARWRAEAAGRPGFFQPRQVLPELVADPR